jgi:uncharacterized protein
MELTKVERRLLANQYHILSLLDEGNAEYYDNLRDALESGYASAYEDEVFGWILDPLPRSESVLDKTGIEQWRTEFPGFDGNHETAYMGYAQFVVEEEGRFGFLKPHSADFNSHMPTLESYRRMIDVWKLTNNRYELTRDDIIAVLDASRVS